MTKESPSTEENREAFLSRLRDKFSKVEIDDIEFAYDLSKEAHRTAIRDEGVRYFEHPRAGCLIMMDELGLYDYELLISFLLHDSGEDTPLFGNIKESYYEFVRKARYRITKLFNEKIAENVIRLSKPWADGIRFNTQEEADAFYHSEIKKDEDVIILKMVDRLHNLRSLPSSKNPEKIERKVGETKTDYLPIFKSVVGTRKQYAEILLSKVEAQLAILESEPAA